MTWRRVAALAVALATLAAAPMSFAPWDEDEVFLVGAVRGTSPWMNSALDAYRFSSGDPSAVAARVSEGIFPWYIAADFKYALFRPLTSALLWLDATLFGDNRLGFQLDALAWHAALIAAAALVLRRAIPGRAGQGALLLFAASVVHTTPTGWLTARHVLVAGVPAFFGLVAHRRWREDRWRAGLPLSIVCFSLALLGSEAGAQVLAYVVAYELCRREVPWRARARGLVPLAGVVVAYALLYRALGRGHDYASATALVTGIPRLFVHAFVVLGVSVRPDNPWGYDALRATMLVVVPLAFLGPGAIRRLDPIERRGALWLSLGALLSIVPVVGTPLESRVLVAPSLGAAVIVAVVLRDGLVRARQRTAGPLVILGSATIAFVHVVLAPVELPQHYLAMSRARDRRFGTFVRATRADAAGLDHFVVGSPHFLYGQLGGYLRGRMTGVQSRSWVPLADANCAHTLRRTAPERVEITYRCPSGFFPYGRLERGDEVKQVDWTVRVLGEDRFEVVFPRPIEDLPVVFVTFEGFTDRRVALPSVGEAIDLPQPAPPELYALDGPTQWLHAHFE